MNGNTHFYHGNLYLTGDIHKGTFGASTGSWAEGKNLDDYFVMKGVKDFTVYILIMHQIYENYIMMI